MCRLPACLALLLLPAAAVAQTSYPMITHALPVAVRRGQTTPVTVLGQQDFAGAYEAVFEGAGVTARVVPGKAGAAAARSVQLEVAVAADALPGVREFRVATRSGLSSVGQLVVSEHPVVVEKTANNTRAQATPVVAPCVVAGVLEVAEDVDFYKFRARAGQAFTFEAHCARLQDKIHDLQKHADPILVLQDADGRELAANDDFYFADPLLTYTFAKDGEYYLQVRDSKYDGDPRWAYALLVSDRPHASHVFPPAGNPGKLVDVEPVGSAGQGGRRGRIKAPATPGLHEVILDLGGGAPGNPVPFLVSDLPQAVETEPNDQAGTATRLTLPCGVSGRVGRPGDVDHFAFKAAKGKAVRLEVKARRFGTQFRSTLDSVLDVLSPAGAVLATNDDAVGKDAALVFTPPADGDYVVRLRDLNSKGGPAAVYYLEAELARPDFSLKCDGDKAMIGPGGRAPWFVQVARVNGFTGAVKVEAEGLPAGVSVNPLTIPAGMTQGLLVLHAAPGAAVGVSGVRLRGTGSVEAGGKSETLVREATPMQEIYFPGGGRGVFPVSLQTVAVTEPADILDVELSTQAVTLKPGEEVRVEVTVKRKPGFDKGVSLDVPLRHLGTVFGNPLPPGVTLVEGKSKTLLGGASKGHVVLKAAADAAPAEGVPVSVLCHVSVNFVVKVSYSSAPLLVSVRK